MSSLNGDSLKVVELIRKAINDNTAQTNKRLDDIIASNKEVNDNQQKLIDAHCKRLRQCEEENTEMRPIKKFYSKLRDYALGLIIFLGATVMIAAVWIKAHLVHP